MASIRMVNLNKCYNVGDANAVDDVTLEIDDGEFFVLLGPSGCGKSTLLRLIAGLEEITSGELWLGQLLANYAAPGKRDAAMVFQNYALYPHMTVLRNIEFPLRMGKVDRDRRRETARAAAVDLGLDDLLDRKVSDLSGGQRQRVALGRALVRQPSVLLMDEPLSNLDALLRVQTREQLLALHRRIPTTTVYVTHDQVEAMTMGDRIAVLDRGRLIQVGTPAEIYEQPATRFVAGFIGNPPMNFVEGNLAPTGSSFTFRSCELTVDVTSIVAAGNAPSPAPNARATLGVRPEDLTLAAEGPWTAEFVEDLGADKIVTLTCDTDRLRVRVERREPVRVGDAATVEIRPGAVHLFDQHGKNYAERKPPARSLRSARS